MAALLNFVDRRYGGPDAYLDSIGFGEDRRRALRAQLLVHGEGEIEG